MRRGLRHLLTFGTRVFRRREIDIGEEREGILNLNLGALRRRKTQPWLKTLRLVLRFIWFTFKWSLALALPFIVLVQGSLYAYQEWGWGTWPSLVAGVFATEFVFLAYTAWLWKWTTEKQRAHVVVRRVLAVAVVGYSVYGLLYLSPVNGKSPEVREYYSSLHPLMRMGASAYLLFDRDGVATDLERTVEDYLSMGLPVNEMSLHFKLEDRYFHALDVRTIGRSEWRNRLTAMYFQLMGFQNLHYVGTANHLHISLPVTRRGH